jgi:signal transduction histidine kinase/CheY-like chemotaxis protein
MRAFAFVMHRSLHAWACAALWLAAGLLGASGAAHAEPETIRVFDHAEFRSSETEHWTPVRLPDTWALRGIPSGSLGEYRLMLSLDSAPSLPWVLALDRISPTHQIYLNQALIDTHPPENRMVPAPGLIRLPPHLLHAGDNELRLVLRYSHLGGLSTVQAGPAHLLERSYAQALWWEHELTQHLNLVAAVLAVLLLTVAWRQPREQAIGLFGALELVSSVRNYVFYGNLLTWPNEWIEKCLFTAIVWMGILLLAYAYCLRFGRPLPRPRLFWGLMCCIPALVACLPAAWLPTARVLTYAVLAVMNLRAIQYVVAAARSARDFTHWALCASLLAIFIAALHDFAFQLLGWLPITHSIALTRVLPLALFSYSGLLLVRLFDAMAQVDQLNRTLETRVALRTRDLDAANAAKTRFIANASHDLRQPLVSVGLLLSLLRQEMAKTASSTAVQDLFARLGRAVSAMEDLLKHLLDFSRLDGAGRTPPKPRAVKLQDIFEAVQAHEASHAQLKGLRLRMRPTPHTVLSDPVLLEQILRNLVNNAIRYTEGGGVLVAVRTRRLPGQVQLCVWDTGAGIAADAQEAIFEPFVQLHNPGRVATEGLGLGLAIVRHASLQLGHALELSSRTGRGSCFRLTLALTDVDGTPHAQGMESSADAAILQGRTAWLVEDNDTVRDALVLQLTQWRMRLQSFSCATDLQTHMLATQDWPELFISDARLPDGNGLDLILEMRASSPMPIATLLVTGNTSPDQLARQERSGVTVLHKPFGSEELLQALSQELRSLR